MILRPRFRLPLWAVLAIAGTAYLLRSIVLRDGDFRVDRADLIVCAMATAVVLLAYLARRTMAGNPGDDEPTAEDQSEGSGTSKRR